LVEVCREKGLEKIIGYHFKTEKNAYVSTLLSDLKFCRISDEMWELNLMSPYVNKNQNITIRMGKNDG